MRNCSLKFSIAVKRASKENSKNNCSATHKAGCSVQPGQAAAWAEGNQGRECVQRSGESQSLAEVSQPEGGGLTEGGNQVPETASVTRVRKGRQLPLISYLLLPLLTGRSWRARGHGCAVHGAQPATAQMWMEKYRWISGKGRERKWKQHF